MAKAVDKVVAQYSDTQWKALGTDMNLPEADFSAKYNFSKTGVRPYYMQWQQKKNDEAAINAANEKVKERDEKIKEKDEKIHELEVKLQELQSQIDSYESASEKPEGLCFQLTKRARTRKTFMIFEDTLERWNNDSENFEDKAALLSAALEHFLDYHLDGSSFVYHRPKTDETDQTKPCSKKN